MSFPGEILTCDLNSKLLIFNASILYELKIRVQYTFWEDESFTVHQITMLVPGYPEMVLPYPFKNHLLNDRNFKEIMTGVIRSIRHQTVG